MKTETKSLIIRIVSKKGAAGPTDLVRALGISNQAVHRHLRDLVLSGVLEQRGRPPTTQYVLAGIPDFSLAFAWIKASSAKTGPRQFMCETRDVLTARLGQFKAFVRQGLAVRHLPILISVVGEIGNNSFDHNLGQWRDVPGCWLEAQVTGGQLWVCIADRGQGIYQSLIRVDATIPDEQTALTIAFEKFISGRAPEKRGNGLKYVKNAIIGVEGRGLVCLSGRGRVNFGSNGGACDQLVKSLVPRVDGTLTLLVWDLK